jgi:hypothetical protein
MNPPIDPRNVSIQSQIVEYFNYSTADEYCVLPFELNEDNSQKIFVAAGSEKAIDFCEKMRFVLNCRIDFVPVREDWLRQAIRMHYLGDKAKIQNCQESEPFECPKLWAKLIVASDGGKRLCRTCNRFVTWCDTIDEVAVCNAVGECAAYGEVNE